MRNIFKTVGLILVHGLIGRLRQNILGKIALLLVGGAISVAILPTPIIEWLCAKLFDYVSGQNVASNFWPPFSFYVLFTSGISLGLYVHRTEQKNKPKLIYDVTKSGSFQVRNSNIVCFLGSVEKISDIDVVVTSENTYLDLGSISGTSVSGRVRKMAASFNEKNELEKDFLDDFISEWKINNGLGPFTKGRCIISPPFNAEKYGVKSIIHAVAIEKNSNNCANIEFSAIKKIVDYSVNHLLDKSYKSIFIPVFGLGSGQAGQADAINYTVDAVKSALERTENDITVYIGVYRADDGFSLIKQLAIKTL